MHTQGIKSNQMALRLVLEVLYTGGSVKTVVPSHIRVCKKL
jgi:hypothetical protein